MAVPTRTQLFDAFLGSQEGIHSIILPDIFSSGGSKNLFIDKFGRAKKISGYSKQNSSALTTNTGGTAARFRSYFPYRKVSGGSTTRQLFAALDDAVNEWEIHYSTDSGATWTFVVDLGSTSINTIPDFTQFGDDLFITNGVMVPRRWNGSALSNAGATQSPTPSSAESSNAGNLLGNYRYKLVTLHDDGTRGKGSTSSTALAVQDKQVDLSWSASGDTSVVGYEVYRTTGTGTVFYFTSYVDGRLTVAFTDNIPDITILENRVMEEHGDPPQTGIYYCEDHKSRMWWARTDTYPTRAWWSDAGDADSVLSDNYLEFVDTDTMGDHITGMLGNFEGLLVVFTERALWTVSGTGQVIGNIVDWTKTRTNAQVGSVHHRTVVRIPAGAKYVDQNGAIQTTSEASIAYFTPLGDIRLFDGDNDIIISHPMKDTLSEFNYAQRAKFHALHDTANQQIIWFIVTGSNGEPNRGIVWNYRWGIWYTWETMPFSASIETETSSDAQLLLVGEASTSKGAYCYQLLSGNSFDGDPIESIWMTKTLVGVNDAGQPALSNTKRWRWLDLLFEVNQDVTLTVEWLSGTATDDAAALGSVQVNPAARTLITADGSTILTASSSSIVVSLASAQSKAALKAGGGYLHDEGIRVRVKDNAANGSWSLEALQLAYQILPGMKRRFQ
jgi:hypothetical protein